MWCPRVDQIEIVKPRRPAVEKAQAILAARHAQHRLDLAVHGYFIARHTLGRALVEGQALVRVETLGLKDERVVIGMARQMQRVRGGILFVARVELVEEQLETGHAAVDVRGGEIHGVVVVPQRLQSLARIAVAVDLIIAARLLG